MSLKRRITTSYVIITLVALLTLLGIGGIAMLGYYANYNDSTDISYYQVEKNSTNVKNLLSNYTYSKQTYPQLVKKLHQYKYRVRIFYQNSNKNIHVDNFSSDEWYFLDSMTSQDYVYTKATQYQWGSSAFIARAFKVNGKKICIVTTRVEKYRQKKYYRHLTKIDLRNRIIFTLIAGVLIIAIVLATIFFFSRRTLSRIMRPLDKLVSASKRIEKGKEFVPIVYNGGDYEMEVLIKSFNDMQESIKRYMEKNSAYERARTKMISGISHDLNTPLTSIKGCLKGILDGVARTPQRRDQYIQIAYNKVGEMETLLQQLFYLSKLETGNMPVNIQTIDLVDFIRHINEINKLTWGERNAQVNLNYDKKSHQVKVDADQLQRVFINIIENSIKYNDKKQTFVNIRIEESGQYELLEILDNGPGVPENKLNEVFSEFYRVDESRNTNTEGSGLGLYIAKTIIMQSGGKITATNDNGLKISIYLPRVN